MLHKHVDMLFTRSHSWFEKQNNNAVHVCPFTHLRCTGYRRGCSVCKPVYPITWDHLCNRTLCLPSKHGQQQQQQQQQVNRSSQEDKEKEEKEKEGERDEEKNEAEDKEDGMKWVKLFNWSVYEMPCLNNLCCKYALSYWCKRKVHGEDGAEWKHFHHIVWS